MDELISLFPTPFLRSTGVLPPPLVEGLIQYFVAQAKQDNNTSPGLTHTRMLKPGDSPLFIEAAALITPKLVDFGVQLFGERMGWALKEMWSMCSTPAAIRPCTTTPTVLFRVWST